MGKILGLKTLNDKIHVNLELTTQEAMRLEGNMDNVHIFSEHNFFEETRLVQRGKRESTKYFLLPRSFRKNVYPCINVKCYKIETPNKSIFIFKLNKLT